MNCTMCNQPLNEGDLFCKSCGHRTAVAAQKAKLEASKSNVKNVLAAKLHSVIFLIFTICFTVMFAAQIVSMFTSGVAGILSGLLPFIFMLISMIGLWKSYSVKSGDKLDKASLRNASIFDAYTRVMYTLSIVLVSIMTAIMAIFLLVASDILADLLGMEEITGGIVTTIVFLVVMAVVITLISIYRGIFANRRRYFLALEQTAKTGVYNVERVPVVGSWFIGICNVLGAIPTLAFAISIDVILDSIVSSLDGSMGDLVETVVAGGTSVFLASGVSTLICGAYFILSAIWMSKVHKAEIALRGEIAADVARLAALEEATKQALLQYEVEKRQIEEAKARALAEERRAAELAAQQRQNELQEQQHQMMQMMMQMMQQLMQQNPNAFAANEAEPQEAAVVEEAPAIEADVVEEAPAAEAVVAEETPIVEVVATEEIPAAEQ